jgi:hypothetical protein
MASMTFKRVAVVATLATSMVLMGGSAFAGLLPDPAGKAQQIVRNTEADTLRQVEDAF